MLALDYEDAGGDPENARPGGHDFFFFFISGEEPDEEPEPPKKRHSRSASPKAPVAPSSPPDSAPLTPFGQSGPVKAVERPQRAAQTPQTPSGASPLIMDAVQRLSRVHKRTGRASDKSIEQFTGIAALFVEITGVDDVRAVRQHHIAAFVDAMDRLPPTYRRSAAERDKPIAAIIAEAEATGAETGLSAATVNRNLIQLGKVFKGAQSEGIRVDPSVNPSLLRRFEKKNAKDDRDPFTPDDVKRIFAAPVWTGAKSAKRRRDPGEIVVKDWLYWVPLIAAYTGARREEICGLETADIDEEDGVPVIIVRPNARRGLKNAQSQRRIPIHSHLIDLGFLDYVREQRMKDRTNLFHDLNRKSPKSQIGDSTAYLWRNIQNDMLGPQAKKSFHSFRHYAVQGLRAESDVEKHVRAELFGHLVGDIEDDRYGGRAPITALRAAVEALPRVF
ncbi:hypothetical protein B0A89_11085 [Paracoccus contaminans]|uniref:Tyr recombinase domain-containing protein n=2 Tax=Paracoccus contaminans TaxID=1945662 RepID=A0A1W6CZ35_9RHOB|nr:hypothetical protein B0A89_11085 [Paracoccus contaminans]